MSATASNPASTPAAAPAAPPATPANGAPAQAPVSAPSGEASPPAADGLSLAGLAKQIEEMKSLLTQTAEAKEAATKQANEATAQKATIEQQLGQFKEMWKADKGSAALADAARQVQYASPLHAENALQVFKGTHRIEVRESGEVVAIGADGKAQGVRSAFASWVAGPSGAIYRASPVQPGAGAPAATIPDGGAPKMPKDMTPAEFAAFKAAGVSGKLHPSGPTMGVKTQVSPFAEARNRLLGMANGTAAQRGK